MSDVKPFAFVLMPFSSDFRDIYNLGIKQTATELGVVAERVDEQNFSETMLDRIYRQIDTCDFVIADMSGQNPNVFYEVGYAHAKNKLCALITRDANDIPFDLKHHVHIIYDGSVSDLKSKLEPKLEWLKSESVKRKTETISLTVRATNEILEKSDFSASGSVDLNIKMRNASEQRSPEIEAVYLTTSPKWEMSHRGISCPHEVDKKSNTKRFLVTPDLKRLSPRAFLEIKVSMRKRFWSKFSGDELKDVYSAKGTLVIEVVTSEGTFKSDHSISVDFEEFPF